MRDYQEYYYSGSINAGTGDWTVSNSQQSEPMYCILNPDHSYSFLSQEEYLKQIQKESKRNFQAENNLVEEF